MCRMINFTLINKRLGYHPQLNEKGSRYTLLA